MRALLRLSALLLASGLAACEGAPRNRVTALAVSPGPAPLIAMQWLARGEQFQRVTVLGLDDDDALVARWQLRLGIVRPAGLVGVAGGDEPVVVFADRGGDDGLSASDDGRLFALGFDSRGRDRALARRTLLPVRGGFVALEGDRVVGLSPEVEVRWEQRFPEVPAEAQRSVSMWCVPRDATSVTLAVSPGGDRIAALRTPIAPGVTCNAAYSQLALLRTDGTPWRDAVLLRTERRGSLGYAPPSVAVRDDGTALVLIASREQTFDTPDEEREATDVLVVPAAGAPLSHPAALRGLGQAVAPVGVRWVVHAVGTRYQTDRWGGRRSTNEQRLLVLGDDASVLDDRPLATNTNTMIRVELVARPGGALVALVEPSGRLVVRALDALGATRWERRVGDDALAHAPDAGP